MKSTVTFKNFFKKFLKEDTTSGALVASNVAAIYDPDNPVSVDKYNAGDVRIAKGGKVILSRKGKVKTKKLRKK